MKQHVFTPAARPGDVRPGDTRKDHAELARWCKALGHPARVAILRRLLAEDRCFCGEIVDVMPLSQSTVSQHLRVLREAGLVSGTVEGPRTCYCADRDALARMLETLIGVLTTGEGEGA